MRTILFAALSLAASTVSAQSYVTERGTVTFTSSVPLHTFSGTSSNLSGAINLSTRVVDFHVDLETLRTGIGRRDRDMRETLETDRFPFAEFTGRLTSAFNPGLSGPQRVRVQGTFTIHGVARQKTVTGTLEPTRGGLRLRAQFDIELADYNITPPRLLLLRVDQTQAVSLDATLRPS